jgi:hypothetical protein
VDLNTPHSTDTKSRDLQSRKRAIEMQLQTALLLALACIAHSKLDVPEVQLETIIDSMTSMAAAVPAFTAHPGRIVDGKSVANGLEQSCNNKFCSMMYYASVREIHLIKSVLLA